MRNALFYKYGLSISDIYRKDNYYYFFYDDLKYIVMSHDYTYKDLEFKLYLADYLKYYGIRVHSVLKTKDGNWDFLYEEKNYILMCLNYDWQNEQQITLDEIITFSNKTFLHHKPISYAQIWSEKIDYIEYQMREMGKDYNLIRDSIAYFIGLGENAITLSSFGKSDIYCVSHNKLSLDPLYFYNPLTFIIDMRIRDIAEFFKRLMLEKKIQPSLFMIGIEGLNDEEIILLYARLLFPNYYFDLVEDCLLDGKEEKQIKEVIKNRVYFEKNFVWLYDLLGFLPPIEWLDKLSQTNE